MCDPITISAIALGVSTIGSVVSYKSGKNAADRQEAANAAFEDANKRDAIDNASLNFRELALRQSEELLASGTSQFDISKDEQSVFSTARVSAAEAGVSGNSVDAVLNDIEMQGSEQRGRVSTNADMTMSQLQREKQSVIAHANSQINLSRQPSVNRPSIATPLLNIAGSTLQSIDYVQSRKRRAKVDD